MPKAKKPIYKKWWFWVIIAVVFIIVVASLGGGNDNPRTEGTSPSASSASPEASEKDKTVEESNSQTEDAESDTSSASPEASEKDGMFGIGDTAVFKTIKITADELRESTGENFFEPQEGKVFVGIRFTIENISDRDRTISSILLFDAYVDGVKCAYSFSANCAFNDGTIDGTISAGKKMVGFYSVEVPSDWAELELQVKSSWLSNSKAVFVFNK